MIGESDRAAVGRVAVYMEREAGEVKNAQLREDLEAIAGSFREVAGRARLLHVARDTVRARQEGGTPLYRLSIDRPWKVRLLGALEDAHLTTLEQIAGRSRAELLAIDGIGKGSLQALGAAMHARGLRFRDEAVMCDG